jgi:ATP-dependent Lon protease
MRRFSSRPSADTAAVAGYAGDLVRDWLARRATDHAMDADHLSLTMYQPEAARDRLRGLPGRASEAAQTMHAFVNALLKTPAVRRLASPPMLHDVLALKHAFPNFGEAVDTLAQATALANLHPKTSPRFAPLLLVGPPGIGKTVFSRAVARTFGVPFHMLQFGHATASFSLGGLDLQYASGGPGWLANTVALSKYADPFVLLDEIEKAEVDSRHDPRAALYSLWDDSAAAFVDDGLKVPLDFSGIRWIATCNDTTRLHGALISRCTVVNVPPPTRDQVASIAMNIYATLLSDAPWGRHFEPQLRAEVVEVLAEHLPRDIKKSLVSALGLAALRGQRYISAKDLVRVKRRPSIGFLSEH